MITATSFTARWEASSGATGYRLDVAEDADFTVFVPGFEDLDVGDVTEALISGLTGETTYYVRVRAYNEIGTSANSEIKEVTTTAALTDMDGNTYSYVRIGSQEWIVENLKVTKYKDGTDIPNITNDTGTGELITAWDNTAQPYDIFNASANNIIYARNSSMDNQSARTNLFAVIGGQSLSLRITYQLLSGTAPVVWLYAESEEFADIPLTLVNGVNEFNIDVGAGVACNAYIEATNYGTAATFSLKAEASYSGWTEDEVGGYCWYNNNIANKTPYGAIYNWYAVNSDKGLAYFEKGGVQDPGWRVATKSDWYVLRAFAGGPTIAGGKLKETGLLHWNAPNTGATDEYGFTTVGSGERDAGSGLFDGIGLRGEIWTSTADEAIPELQSYYAAMFNNNVTLDVGATTVDHHYGFAVRCVRDV